MRAPTLRRPLSVSLLLWLAACGSRDADQSPVSLAQEPALPPKQPALEKSTDASAGEAVTAARIELGKWLFFDARLSKSGKTSCSTCHLPELAWTDGRATSPKDDGTLNTRNAPTMYNVGALDRLYWDGRAATLEKNILAAWKAQMGGNPEAVAQQLATVPQYAAQFQLARLQPPNEVTIVDALATFLRSLKSGNSPFDRWQNGDQAAVSQAAIRGYELFMGKAGCAVCHMAPHFTDRTFHGTGLGMDREQPDVGAGGEKALNDKKLVGWFKTPTLREVAVTAPYFHDGSVATLEEAVRFMAGGGKAHPTRSGELFDRQLDDAEIGQIVAFLQTLTSEQTVRPPALPQ